MVVRYTYGSLISGRYFPIINLLVTKLEVKDSLANRSLSQIVSRLCLMLSGGQDGDSLYLGLLDLLWKSTHPSIALRRVQRSRFLEGNLDKTVLNTIWVTISSE